MECDVRVPDELGRTWAKDKERASEFDVFPTLSRMRLLLFAPLALAQLARASVLSISSARFTVTTEGSQDPVNAGPYVSCLAADVSLSARTQVVAGTPNTAAEPYGQGHAQAHLYNLHKERGRRGRERRPAPDLPPLLRPGHERGGYTAHTREGRREGQVRPRAFGIYVLYNR